MTSAQRYRLLDADAHDAVSLSFCACALSQPPRIQQEELRALQEASSTHGFNWQFVTYLNHPRTNFGRAAVQILSLIHI